MSPFLQSLGVLIGIPKGHVPLWRVQGEALESFPCGIIEHRGREGTA